MRRKKNSCDSFDLYDSALVYWDSTNFVTCDCTFTFCVCWVCTCTCMCVGAWAISEPYLPQKNRLWCYTESLIVLDLFRPIPAALEWQGDGDGYLMHRLQSAGLIHTTSRSSSNVVSLCAAVHAHAQSVCWSALVTKSFVHKTIATSFNFHFFVHKPIATSLHSFVHKMIATTSHHHLNIPLLCG